MLHVISARYVARDLHTIALGPLYVLETVCGAMRRLFKKKKKISNFAFQCDCCCCCCCCCYHYYYDCRFRWRHRPSTTPRHRTLVWAALVIPDQLVPCCFSSALVSRLQLLRGRPLFLFPCGFQVRAWRVVLDAGFLRVCPIQPHFLRSICSATGSCPARSHR